MQKAIPFKEWLLKCTCDRRLNKIYGVGGPGGGGGGPGGPGGCGGK